MVREISVQIIQDNVREMIEKATYQLPADYLHALKAAQRREQSAIGQSILLTLQENAAYAQSETIPTCQDTGMAFIALEIGQDVHFLGGSLPEALTTAVRQAYRPLRKSVVADPLQRHNTADNTPPIIHYRIVDGDQVQVTVLLKGFGAELMSRLQMFPPAVGVDGVKQFILEMNESGNVFVSSCWSGLLSQLTPGFITTAGGWRTGNCWRQKLRPSLPP